MKAASSSPWILGSLLFSLAADVVKAQIIPDDTLPENSRVEAGCTRCTIDGGTTQGNNLFHSFREFSVFTGGSAAFNNAPQIENIFTRVTGNSVSNIDGVLRSNGTANLFLLNPNGILFGPNARLNLGGSFLASTADSILFDNGFAFTATNPQASPLLTVNAPMGLQYGVNPGSINVQGRLGVNPGQTLALVGGEMALEGGNLTAAGGQIELGSVAANSLVAMTPTNPGWALNYQGVRQFQDIRLSQAARVDASGSGGGSIQVQGRRLSLTDGSQIVSVTEDTQAGRDVIVRATESVEMVGFNPQDGTDSSSLTTQAESTGNGGNLTIETGTLRLADGGSALTRTLGAGNSGSLTVRARSVDVIGFNPQTDENSRLATQTRPGSTGNAGDLTIRTGTLRLVNGGIVSTSTRGEGDSGDLTVRAQSVEAIGFVPGTDSPSALDTQARGLTGNAGTLTIQTGTLRVANGARISTRTFGSGDGGNLTVQARSIDVTGFVPRMNEELSFSSFLASQANQGSTGDAGDLTIQTGTLRVANGALISTNTFGEGDGGNLTVQARSVDVIGFEPRSGFSSALVAQANSGSTGNAGNLTIQTRTLRVADGSIVSTRTFGEGDGGNLTVQARSVDVVGFEPRSGYYSFLATEADAESTGNAGRISLTTDRLRLANRGEIRATSGGTGRAGNIRVQAASQIILADDAHISSNTNAGEGNINLTTPFLLLRQGSSITTNANGNANGGNININAEDGFVIAAPVENSDIFARADRGTGGRIDITAQQVLGFQESSELASFSEINASSDFGTAGTIFLNTLDVNPSQGLTELPADITDASSLVALGCSPAATTQANQGEFYQTGRGGIAPLPTDALGSSDILEDLQLPNSWNATTATNAPIQEAQGWQVNDRGDVILLAELPNQHRPCGR